MKMREFENNIVTWFTKW